MEKSQDCDEVGRTTKSGQNRPESFTVGGVEGLGRINESHVKVLVLFPAFLFNLSCRKDHVRYPSRCPEATRAFM